ncbi:MAG: redoxin domain-containing protein [Candidatus Zixiibacteriota bacterium]
MGHCTYQLWMKKPNYARLEGMRYGSESKGILVGDGDYFWIYWPNGRPQYEYDDSTSYAKTRFNVYTKIRTPTGMHSIAHEIDRLGLNTVMTIIEPSVFHGYTDPFDSYLDGVRWMGAEKIGQEECEVIEVSFMNHQRSRYLWLSKADHLPRKLKEIIRVGTDIIKHEQWSNVSTDDEILMDKFSWKPPADWQQWQPPSLEEGLLKPGTEAPDFDLTSTKGSRFRLSDQRGKAVWLVFWRVGCQVCREEIPYVEQLYRKHKDKGLIIIGLNCADDKKIALDFLKKNSVTFPVIVDSSESATKTFFKDYQRLQGMSAVPLNYVIDSEGRVRDAWYGYEKGDERGVLAIRKMGIK